MTAKCRKYSMIIAISIENDYNLMERGFSRSCQRMGRWFWINVSTHFTNGAITSDRQPCGLWRLYFAISPFLLSGKYTNDQWNNRDSGPLLAQAMDSTEFRNGTSCDPCLFEALAGPETGRASLNKNHPNLPDWVWLNRRDREQPRCLKAKFRYPVRLSVWRCKSLGCIFYGDRRSVQTKYCKSLHRASSPQVSVNLGGDVRLLTWYFVIWTMIGEHGVEDQPWWNAGLPLDDQAWNTSNVKLFANGQSGDDLMTIGMVSCHA